MAATTVLRQVLLIATPNRPNPAHEEVCERPGMTHLLAFHLLLPSGFKQLDSNPINWAEAAGALEIKSPLLPLLIHY